MNTIRMAPICMAYFSGSTQNSRKKLMRPSISTGVQKMMTVAMAMRMLAPHAAIVSCFFSMNTEPTKQPSPTRKVTGWWSPRKFLS